MNASPQNLTELLAGIACVDDYEPLAKERIRPDIWAYLNAGSADGITHQRNLQAFHELSLLPRMLTSVAGGNTGVNLFGFHYRHPILIAPSAYHKLVHAEGEKATAVAAEAMKTPYIVSTQASLSLEDISQSTQGPLWFQVYMQVALETSLDLIRRAEAAGYQAIVITVDAPIQGLRNEDQRRGFQLPGDIQPVNLLGYPTLQASGMAAGESIFEHPFITHMATWDDIAKLTASTRLPVLLKGILHPLDVQPALDAGVAGIIVSNHGGRTLDTAASTLSALPDIVAAVNQRVPVLMDGGIRRGTDIFKALALGASAVMIGRPVLYGLAVAGATGVAHVLNLLRSELEATMVLTGCKTLADINSSYLKNR